MKTKVIFSTIFLSASVISSFLLADSSQFLSYDEWIEISALAQENINQIVLTDGTKLQGKVEKLPSLRYTFATFDFQPQEIIALAVVKSNAALKMQYITQSGQNYVAACSNEKIVCTFIELNLSGIPKNVKKEIDPALVDYIILSKAAQPYSGYNSTIASLELRNGDRLPVALISGPIIVTDGWIEKFIKPDNIVYLSFEGGLSGKIKKDERIVDLDFSYIKDPYLLVQLPRNQHHMKFPWTQIASIQTFNGGFFREDLVKNSTKPLPLPSENIFDSTPSKIGIGWQRDDENTDQIGLKNGEALLDVLAAVALSQETIAKIEDLGNESIIATESLFYPAEEGSWESNIFLEDMKIDRHEEIINFIVDRIKEINSNEAFESKEFNKEKKVYFPFLIENNVKPITTALENLNYDETQKKDRKLTVNDEPVSHSGDIDFEIFDFSERLIDLNLEDVEDYITGFFLDHDFENLEKFEMDEELKSRSEVAFRTFSEDFDIPEHYVSDEEVEIEQDYLETIAREVDISPLYPEAAYSEIDHADKIIIGIDEIIAQDAENIHTSPVRNFKEDDQVSQIIDYLWGNSDNVASSLNDEMVLVDELLK